MGVCLIVALTPVVTWVVPIVLRKRSSKMLALARNARRNTLSALGVLLLLWTLDFLGLDFVRANMEADELSFVIIGLVQVFAGVLILTRLAAQVPRSYSACCSCSPTFFSSSNCCCYGHVLNYCIFCNRSRRIC